MTLGPALQVPSESKLVPPRSPHKDVPIDVGDEEDEDFAIEQDPPSAVREDVGNRRHRGDIGNTSMATFDNEEENLDCSQSRSPLSELIWAITVLQRSELRKTAKSRNEKKVQTCSTPSIHETDDGSDAVMPLRAAASSSSRCARRPPCHKNSENGAYAKILPSQSSASSPSPPTKSFPKRSPGRNFSPSQSRRRPTRSGRNLIAQIEQIKITTNPPALEPPVQAKAPKQSSPPHSHSSAEAEDLLCERQIFRPDLMQRRRAATSPARTVGIEQSPSGLFIPHSGHAASSSTRLRKRRPASLHLDVDSPDPRVVARQHSSGNVSLPSSQDGASSSAQPARNDGRVAIGSRMPANAPASTGVLLPNLCHPATITSPPETTTATSLSSSSTSLPIAPGLVRRAPFTAAAGSATSMRATSIRKKPRSCNERCPHRLKHAILSGGPSHSFSSHKSSPYSCACLFPTPLTAPRTWSEDVLSAVLGYDRSGVDEEGFLY